MPPAPLRQLVYGSTATSRVTDEDLVSILHVSRRKNSQAGVTGALLYADGNFIQVLEGSSEAISDVYSRILGDDRHSGVLTLYDAAVPERTFQDWSMGFLDPSRLHASDRESVRSLLALTEQSTGVARQLMSSFRTMISNERNAVHI